MKTRLPRVGKSSLIYTNIIQIIATNAWINSKTKNKEKRFKTFLKDIIKFGGEREVSWQPRRIARSLLRTQV